MYCVELTYVDPGVILRMQGGGYTPARNAGVGDIMPPHWTLAEGQSELYVRRTGPLSVQFERRGGSVVANGVKHYVVES